MAQDPHADYDHFDTDDAAERIRETAAEHPGVTALVSLLSSPLAIKAGGVALRWARRNPLLAVGLAAGAYVLWKRRQRAGVIEGYAETVEGSRTGGSGDRDYDFPGAAHGSVSGAGTSGTTTSGTTTSGAGAADPTRRRSLGGTESTSSASSL